MTAIEALPDTYWIRLRAEVRESEGIETGGCGIVTEYHSEDRAGGWYFDPGTQTYAEHFWLVTSDGTIIDPTADQWGFTHPMRLNPGDPLYDNYRLHLPAGVADDAGETGPLEGFLP